MILFKKAAATTQYIAGHRHSGGKTGFVPTMGALHEGHLSLIRTAKKANNLVVCSIFVNPTQFNDPADFEKYPVTIEKDLLLLEEAGCDLVFLPAVAEIYPHGMQSPKHYDLGHLETIVEGKYRPGHFQGVCMVVERLLEIVRPDNLYLGQKDYQQCMVIQRLIALMNMDVRVNLNIAPTLREKNGLAMSSRNMRLSAAEKELATTIYHSLLYIKEHLQNGSLAPLTAHAQQMLAAKGFKTDYVAIADATDLSEVASWDGKQKLVALVATFLGEVRLIDNMLLN